MSEAPKEVHVRVPATTANMGPGFDCIGMAVDLWNELTVSIADEYEMIIQGEGEKQLPRDETNLVVVGVKKAFELAGKPLPKLKYNCINNIPFARGLGSSSAATVSGLIAGLVLAQHELKVSGHEELLQVAADIETHPDNCAPCLYGGMQLGLFCETDSRWMSTRITIPPGLQLVLFVPDSYSETSEARALLKDTVPRKDAIFNMARLGLLINSFVQNDLDSLKVACEDRLHQPARGTAYAGLYPLVNAALDAGAKAAFLSGAGSTIMAITSGRKGDIYAQSKSERKERDVANAMREVAKSLGIKGRVYVTSPTEQGAQVVKSSLIHDDNQ